MPDCKMMVSQELRSHSNTPGQPALVALKTSCVSLRRQLSSPHALINVHAVYEDLQVLAVHRTLTLTPTVAVALASDMAFLLESSHVQAILYSSGIELSTPLNQAMLQRIFSRRTRPSWTISRSVCWRSALADQGAKRSSASKKSSNSV